MTKLLLLAAIVAGTVSAQDVRTTFVPLRGANAILMEPAAPGPKTRIALIYTHPNINNFNHATGPELARRGYRVLLLNSNVFPERAYEAYVPAISAAIQYLRGLPGVQKVLFVSHSGGGPVVTFYQNVAENGPSACNGPEKILPCRGNLTGLPKAEGLILLDSAPGPAYHQMTSIDPSLGNSAGPAPRKAALDMFDAHNGYNTADGTAKYSADFLTRFSAAQSARSNHLIDEALERLRKIEQGQGSYTDDEPFPVAGIGTAGTGARPFQTDLRLLAHTREPHLNLKADGTTPTEIVRSTRPPQGMNPRDIGTMASMAENLTIRGFLAISAIRTTSEFGMTEDSITGVDWKSSATSVPSNIEGVTVPTLVVTMGCHYFMIPGEIIYDHAAAKDKQYASVEGAAHVFSPCKPQYGDTQKRLFDYVDSWISVKGRF